MNEHLKNTIAVQFFCGLQERPQLESYLSLAPEGQGFRTDCFITLVTLLILGYLGDIHECHH